MKVHLICNAHIDPAWLWELEEGTAEALSTFRVAADFCDEFDGFIFNHNEAILYMWILEHDPELFKRIQDHVRHGRWHIMGGWFLQPDCNMPSGESFVRQALVGRHFFATHFGVKPTTAINFDPFGHTRGLVQILAKSGFTSYIHTRPSPEFRTLPSEYYRWVGYDGSSVLATRRPGYQNNEGAAAPRLERLMEDESDRDQVLALWGIGDHGGGPSRVDLAMIADVQTRYPDRTIIHSTPEAFFDDLVASGVEIPEWHDDVNPFCPGCYTSQIRIKQKHRKLENWLYATEKMAVSATLLGLVDYPRLELSDAQYDLLTAEFHDILPGSSIRPVEEASLRLLDHGLEILSRVRTRLFLALARDLAPPSEEGAIPVVAYNPGERSAEGVWECEFQSTSSYQGEGFRAYDVYHDGVRLPSQVEHEASNLAIDWRKKVVFRAAIPPGSATSFTCVPVILPERPVPPSTPTDGTINLGSDRLQLSINPTTGLVDRLVCDGAALTTGGAFAPVVMDDYEDAWGFTCRAFREKIGAFSLMSTERGSEFSGFAGRGLPSVRIIEDGEVRTVVEALFEYHHSTCIVTYKIPKDGVAFDVDVQVNWQEPNKMLKLAIPTGFADARLLGQVAFGTQSLPTNGDEAVAQRWQAVCSSGLSAALAVADDGIYGLDMDNGELRLSLVRGPIYSALTIEDRPIVSTDRHHPRIDQGERFYSFRVLGGDQETVLSRIDAEAQAFNERPVLISMFPRGAGAVQPASLRVEDPRILCTALKQAETGDGYILRLFNTTAERQSGEATIEAAGLVLSYELGPFEVATYQFDREGAWAPVDMMEGV
jgi:alpha-mannosidase